MNFIVTWPALVNAPLPMLCAASALLLLWRSSVLAAPAAAPAEPNVDVATGWWPEVENTWVPIGWKDHPLRFNVLYNGTLIAQPVRNPSRGQGVQLTFLPSGNGQAPVSTTTQPYQLCSRDGGVGDQGWTDNAAPVLWTRWKQDGMAIRQEVFAHLTGGSPVKTGAEPLFAWVRLSMEKAAPGGTFVLIRINAPHVQPEMDRHKNLVAHPSASAYPRSLRLESATGKTSYLLLDDAAQIVHPRAPAETFRVSLDIQPASRCPRTKPAPTPVISSPGRPTKMKMIVPVIPAASPPGRSCVSVGV